MTHYAVLSNRRRRGFSLIELLTVVTIVAILAAIAIPGYRDHVIRSNRAGAKTALVEDAQFLERIRTESNKYNTDGGANPIDDSRLPVSQSPKDGTAQYTISLTNLTDTTFTLNAVPVSGGVNGKYDKCETLTLDHLGAKQVTGTEGAATCWNK
ncbi:MAG: type IV pilin protein [Gammaproteobacteria bacterium]